MGLHKNSEVEDEEGEWEVDVEVDMEVTWEVMVVVDEEADMVVAADTVVEMVELEDMEVAREDMVEEEHKATIKAFKHFSSPHSSLFSKTIFGNVMYVLYLYLYSNPYSDVELLLHQPKSATLHTFSLKSVSSICFKRHSYDKHYLTTSYFVSDNPTRKNVIISSERKSLKFK